MTLRRLASLALAALVATGSAASAFCGFYVATADEPLTNRASRVVLVHDAGHTVVTMASDVHGDPRQFALVIPVPTVIRRDQVRVVAPETVEHLAEYTKPRLVQYYDEAPCRTYPPPPPAPAPVAMAPVPLERRAAVRVEAAFSVAEYDIQVLSADDSDGLIGWLNRNGYRMPEAAGPVVGSYIAQGMHFFVAKVNLDRAHDLPGGFLHPIRVTYETPKFMLPIRLGTVNASGPQDMIVLALTRAGRVDVTNYRTLRMPTGLDVPEYVADRFGAFYDAAFDHAVQASGGNAVFLEYAWPVARAPAPCATLLGAAAVAGGVRRARRTLGCRQAQLRHAPARALRPGALPRGPAVPGDTGHRDLPGALRGPPAHRPGERASVQQGLPVQPHHPAEAVDAGTGQPDPAHRLGQAAGARRHAGAVEQGAGGMMAPRKTPMAERRQVACGAPRCVSAPEWDATPYLGSTLCF